MTTTTTIGSLDELSTVLTTQPDTWATADAYGLPRSAHADAIDWTALPVFGGDAPASRDGVWSWDATRLLVGACAADLRIVERTEECAYCGWDVPLEHTAVVPASSDDVAWERLASEHSPSCEWILTRAHRVEA